MKRVNWNNATYKDWVGLSAAPVFWLASLICFVLGLAFKNETGILLPGSSIDITVLFSIALGFANTAIQIVGNDTDKEDLGLALFLMWGASYMLGIGSNVNFLYSVIGLNSPILQFLVCWGLGVMIEVAPERLLVKFLHSVGILGDGKPVHQQKVQQPQRQERNNDYPNMNREQRHEAMRTAYQPQQPPIYPNSSLPKIQGKGNPKDNLPPFLMNKPG